MDSSGFVGKQGKLSIHPKSDGGCVVTREEHGVTRVYPLGPIPDEPLVVFEREFDCTRRDLEIEVVEAIEPFDYRGIEAAFARLQPASRDLRRALGR
jgi:hypothetical protein